MQSTSPPAPRPRERRRAQISCTECRGRKQKCNKRKDGPCTNCLRRYPPVECYVQEFEDPKPSRKQKGSRKLDNGTPLHQEASHSSAVDNSIPQRFPAIPLSRILHPISDSLPYHDLPPRERQQLTLVSRITPGFIINEDGPDDSELTPAQRQLKFLDHGNEEVFHKRIASESPRSIGGLLSMMNSFNDMPVKTTLRNTELFHFFHHYVAPRLCSIDGGNIPTLFAREILPWQIKSPLMPNVAILMAAATQSHLQDCDSEGEKETMVIKAHVLKLVNDCIRQDFNLVGNQAMRIVIHLVVIEFYWGNPESMWPHMEGIKQMLNLHGGLAGMNDPLNMHVLIVTDYELACAFERKLVFQSTESALAAQLPLLESYPEKFRSPLIEYPTTFGNCKDVLGLSTAGAEILDDVRFLTTSITSCLLLPDRESIKTSKIQSTATWLHKRVDSIAELAFDLESDVNDIIFDTLRITTLVYTSAIKSLLPISTQFPPALKRRFYTNLALVGLSAWKDIPGIFLWILLVATPSSGEDLQGRWMRKQMACTGMALGLDDFFRGTAYLRSFWVVQRWIELERLKIGIDDIVETECAVVE